MENKLLIVSGTRIKTRYYSHLLVMTEWLSKSDCLRNLFEFFAYNFSGSEVTDTVADKQLYITQWFIPALIVVRMLHAFICLQQVLM